jgi:hypothetical protein
MNAFKVDDLTTSGRKNKAILSKEDQAEKASYRNEGGSLYVPTLCMWCCLVEAGRHVVYQGKKKISTRDSSLLSIGAKILDDGLLLNQTKYEIDERSCVVPATKGRIMVYRPKFNDWELSFRLEVDLTEFSLNTIKELVKVAGKAVGLLAYRPAKKGWFGTFEVIKFEEVK